MIRKFAQLEFRHGSVERGKTLFENLVTTYPRRTDIWSVYIDVCIKFGDIDQARWQFCQWCTYLRLRIYVKIRLQIPDSGIYQWQGRLSPLSQWRIPPNFAAQSPPIKL